MKKLKFYFVTFKEPDIVFGLQIGFYPNLFIWLTLPYIEIRVGWAYLN